MDNISIELNLKPNIKKYTDVYLYLEDYFRFRKREDSLFSYEIWASELGYKSRIFMYLVSQRKRAVTAEFVERFSEFTGMTESEKNHFILLANLEKTNSKYIKNAFFEKILESKVNNEKFFIADEYDQFVVSPTMSLIKMILSFDDVDGTLEEICTLLNIDKDQVKNDLVALEKMGFLVKTVHQNSDEAVWKATSKAFRISSQQTDLIKQKYNERMIEELRFINENNEIFKKFRSILFAVNSDNKNEIENDIENFLTKMKNKYGYDELNEKQLMQVNIQAYPVTKVYNKF